MDSARTIAPPASSHRRRTRREAAARSTHASATNITGQLAMLATLTATPATTGATDSPPATQPGFSTNSASPQNAAVHSSATAGSRKNDLVVGHAIVASPKASAAARLAASPYRNRRPSPYRKLAFSAVSNGFNSMTACMLLTLGQRRA